MKKGIRKFWAIAACIAIVGYTSNSALCETVTISSSISAVANGSTTTLTANGTEYEWSKSTVTSAIANLTGGELNVSGYSTAVTNGALNATSGSLFVNDGVLTIARSSQIAANVNTEILDGAAISIRGGSVELDGTTDFWDGDVNVVSGTLTINNINKTNTGIFTQTDGTTTITGNTAFNLNNASDNISGGTLNIGTTSTSGSLTASKGTIGQDVVVNLSSNSDMKISGGNVTMDSDDTWGGNVNLTNGTLNVNNASKSDTSVYNQIDGTLNVTGKRFDLNNEDDLIDAGTVNIGNGTTSSSLNVSKGTISTDADVNINTKGSLNVSGGSVTLDSSDTWSGNVNVSGGSLALVGMNNKTGAMAQTGGTTTITGSGFDFNNENDYVSGGTLNIGNNAHTTNVSVSQGSITTGATVNINENSTLNINGGNVGLDNKGKWSGNVNISSGTLALNSTQKDVNASFTQTGGTTTVTGTGFDLNSAGDNISAGTLNLGNGTTTSQMSVSQGTIDSGTEVRINSNSTLNVDGGNVNLDSADTWRGNVNISDGNLSLIGINKNTNAVLSQTGGTTTITGTGVNLNNTGDNISAGTLNIGNGSTETKIEVSKGTIAQNAKVNLTSNSSVDVSGGSVFMDNSDTWNGNINVSGGSLALVGITNKSGVLTQTSGTTTVMGSGLDLNNTSDNISGGMLNIGNGTTPADLTVSQGTITSGVNVNLNSNSSVNLNGGNVSLDDSDTWNGNVEMSSGTLNLSNAKKTETGKFTQSGGTTTVTGSGFDLNNTEDNIASGTLNVGNSTTTSEMKVSQGTIAAETSVNVTTNATLNVSGGNVTLNDSDTWNGNVNVAAGNLALVGITKNTSGKMTQTGGITTVTGSTFDLNNTSDNIQGGVFNIGDGTESSTVTVSKGTITQDTQTNITTGSNLNISGGNVSLDGAGDKWDGNINLTSGNLNLNSINKNSDGILTQSGGTTTVTGTGTSLNNENDTISGGNLNIGNGSQTGELNVEKGTVTTDTAISINSGSTLNVNGGTVTVDGNNDNWNGEIKVSEGTLNLNNGVNKTTTSTAKFNQDGGVTNIENSKLTLNTSDSKISGGTINLANTAELTLNNNSQNTSALNSTGGRFSIRKGSKHTTTGGTIDADSTVVIEDSASLEVNGEDANVTLDGNNDTFTGHGILSKGTLNLSNGVSKTTTSTGTYNQTDGTLNVNGNSSLNLNESASKISGGTVNLTDNSSLKVSNGQENSSNLNSTASNITIDSNSTYKTTGGTIDAESVVTVESASKIAIDGEDANVTLDGNTDKADGSIELSNGNLYITDDLTKVTDSNGNYIQTGGKLSLAASKLVLNDSSSKITGGDVNVINASTLSVTQSGGAEISGGNIVIDDSSVLNYLAKKGLIQYSDGNKINIDTSGLINMANNVRTNSTINALTINNGEAGDGQADFAIDIYARSNSNNQADTITANTIKVATTGENGTIHISDWNLNGDILGYDAPIDRNIRLGKIFKSDDIGDEVKFTATDKEIFTPIGYYKLNASSANDGNYTLDLTRFNPQVFRGQAATAASYMNQLVINDTLFNRAQIRRYGASYDQMFKNKTAILDGNASFERTLKEGSLWTEVFGNFETLKLSQNLGKVRNNSWGFIVGGDFGLKELRNGWTYMPSAYIAYHGGHQTFNKVGMWENGVQIGAMNSWMKQNFMETALVYAGLYGTEMNLAGTSEDAFNYFLGIASKSAYDWNIRNNFKIQPSLTLAYNMFGKQNWHSDYGQMSMTSGFLNGFNIAPGVNFIYQKETWNVYATIAYAWNFFGGMDGQAGNVDLPDIKMSHGYLQYGFGMTKSLLEERLMMYAQATVRNIGRTGIICQGGLNWRL